MPARSRGGFTLAMRLTISNARLMNKYGQFSKQPYLDAAIPSLTDPTLAPDGKHVMSIYMQYAPYKLKGDWEEQRKALGQTVVQTLAQYAPNLPELILTHQ